MLGMGFLILHVIIYSSVGILLYALRDRLSLIPFYVYLGILQVYVSMMSSFYVIDIGFGIQVGGGNIVYAAVIWSVMLLYIMERDPDLSKMVIYSLVAVQIIFVLIYPLIYSVLESSVVINPLLIPSEIFQTSFWIFIIGNVLSLLELLAMIFILERLSARLPHVPPTILVILVFIMTLLADGVLFPLLAFPITQSISVVQGLSSIANKLLLGLFFGITMLVAIQILKPKFIEVSNGINVKLSDLFSLPKRDMMKALRTSEEDRSMVRLLLNLLSHDLTNHNQSLLTYLDLIGIKNSDLDEETLLALENAKQIVWASTDLVKNALSLNRIQDEPMKSESVSLSTKLAKALDRLQTTHGMVRLNVKNKSALENVNVMVHPLLADVLYNILSNSVKHRTEGTDEITIELSLVSEDEYYILRIADDGPGIADQDKTRVFQSLSLEDQKGLGLSIVKAILERFNSEIWIENRPDSPNDYTKGTVFALRLPKA